MARLSRSISTALNRRNDGPWVAGSLAGTALVILMAFLLTQPSSAQGFNTRVALVIGNSSYVSAPALPNPANDAAAMSDSLRRLGFDVTEGTDLDTAGMVSALRSFGAKAESADVALVFYAGHGIQVSGENYLLPIDASLQRERDLNYEGMPLNLIISEASLARKLAVVIVDACRDNPFTGQLRTAMGPTRSSAVGRGLVRVDAPADTLVAFATRDGDVAEDGAGYNSPFTSALLTHMGEPGVEIGDYFRRVRDSVITSTNGRQEPYVYGSIGADRFYLNPQSAAPRHDLALSQPAVRPSQGDNLEADIVFWRSIQDQDDATEYRAYLSSFPNGLFADIARNRLNSAEDRDSDRDAAEVAPAAGNQGQVIAEAPPPRRIWNRRSTPGDRYRDDDGDDDDGDDGDDGDDDGDD